MLLSYDGLESEHLTGFTVMLSICLLSIFTHLSCVIYFIFVHSIQSFSISDWLHCLAAGAEDGKVGMTMYSSDGRNFKPGSKAMVTLSSINSSQYQMINSSTFYQDFGVQHCFLKK